MRRGLVLSGRGRMSPFPGIPVHSRAIHPGLALLRSADGWFDAKDLTSGAQQSLPNRADGGATEAQFGSTTGADSSDPARLPHTGTDYVWFPGASGNYVYVNSGVAAHPESAEFEMRFDVEFWTLSPASSMRVTTDGRLFVELGVGGVLRVWYHNGTTYDVIIFASGMAALGVAAGERVQIRFVVNTTTPLCTLYKRSPTAALSDDSGWTEVATAVPASATPLAAFGAAQLVMGGQAAAFAWHGAIYGVYYYDISNAAVLANFDVSTHMASATVVRATSGLLTTVVTRPVIVLDGVDDVLELPAALTPTFTAATGQWTVLQFWRDHIGGNFNRAFSTEVTNNSSFSFQGPTGSSAEHVYVGDGNPAHNVQANRVATPGLLTFAGVVDNGLLRAWTPAQGMSSPASMAPITDPMAHNAPRVGGSGNSMEWFSTAIWPTALSASQLAAAAAYLEAGSYR